MNGTNEELNLLEFLRDILDCTYISDLKFEPFNSKAKLLLSRLNLDDYTLHQVDDALKYIYTAD
jgi:hypothetical protein